MCGRFTLNNEIEELMEEFMFNLVGEYTPRYNIAPSQNILTVINRNEKRVGGYTRWGLVPTWSKDIKIGYKLLNARAETLVEKPSFKRAFKQTRCVIPASGFYEWKKLDKEKQPYLFKMEDDKPFVFLGLYDTWRNNNDNSLLYSSTIITTTPNELTETVHDRMPVITQDNEIIDYWLDPKNENTEALKSLLIPYPAERMKAIRVSSIVNSPKNDVSECMEPINSI